MKYISTRGAASPVSFTQMLLAGLAPDGGLYLPETYPQFSQAMIAGFAGKSYAEVAAAILTPFVAGEIEAGELQGMIEDTGRVATSEAYTGALNVYSYAKASGSAAALGSAVDELGRLFVRRSAAAGVKVPSNPVG